jgi:dTDP-4-dehydrorhamnose reductase
MKILLLGENGQLGWELQRALAPLGELLSMEPKFRIPCTGNAAQLDELAAAVRQSAPQLIVNAAAYTAVDEAEDEPELAQRINAWLPDMLAREAAGLGAWLVHYSTDYVFDGSGQTPWREDSPTAPLNVYGRTKLEGELAIRASGCRHLILRSSWLYAARGDNFVRRILQLASDRERIDVVDDQVGAPTGADLLADLTAHMVRSVQNRPELGGTYHAAASGYSSWHGFARFIVDFARATAHPVKVAANGLMAVPSGAFPARAQRPLNSRLDCSKLKRVFGLELPDWRQGVERMLRETLT